MLPVLFGFVVGIAGFVTYRHWIDASPSSAEEKSKISSWDERPPLPARLVRLLALAAGAVAVLALAFAWHLTAAFWEGHSLWYLPHLKQTVAFLIGTCSGAVSAVWYRDAATFEAANSTIRGVGVGAFAALAILLGLNNDYRVFDRLNKFSTSVVSFELERTQPPNISNAKGTDSISQVWAADERIAFALSTLDDLTGHALKRDREMLSFLGFGASIQFLNENQKILEKRVKPALELRRAIHELRLDRDPIYFGDKDLHQVKLALAYRELIVEDLRTDDSYEAARTHRVNAVAEAFAAYVLHSQKVACTLNIGAPTSPDERDKYCREERTEANEADRKRAEAIAKAKSEAEAKKIVEDFPHKQVVQQTPYMTIVAASLLHAADEKEAAVALLDSWWRSSRRRAAQNADVAVVERLYSVRVLNLIALALSDHKNPIHLELGWRYHDLALSESDALIDGNKQLDNYRAIHKFSDISKFDMISSAALPITDRRNACGGEEGVSSIEARYFVRRRATQVNNSLYYLSMQHDLLEHGGAKSKLVDRIVELRSLRVECLLYLSERTPDKEASRARVMYPRLETLARALQTQAWLERGSVDKHKSLLCDAYRSAQLANRMYMEAQRAPLPLGYDLHQMSLGEAGKSLAREQHGRQIRRLLQDIELNVGAQGGCPSVSKG